MKKLIAAFALTLISLPGWAAQTAPIAAPDPAKIALIKQLFQLTQPQRTLEQMMSQLEQTLPAQLESTVGAGAKINGVPLAETPDFKEYMSKVFSLVQSRLSWSRLEPQFIEAYDNTFTKEELTGIVGFYRSPAGQAYIAKIPALLSQSMAISQRAMQDAGPQLQALMKQYADRIRSQAANGSR